MCTKFDGTLEFDDHESYNPQDYPNDIAIIKFDGTLEFDDRDIVWVILRVITFVHFIRCYVEELLIRRIGKIMCTFKIP